MADETVSPDRSPGAGSSSLVHRAPLRLQVSLGGDLDPHRAVAAARLLGRAARRPTTIELDLTRVAFLAPEAVDAMRRTLPAGVAEGAHLIIRSRPGPVAEVIESAGLAEEDGGPATLVCVRAPARPPDAATEVVMRFYEALAGRDWLRLEQLVADDGARAMRTGELVAWDGIVDHHARAALATPEVRPLVRATESDGHTVIARGNHIEPVDEHVPAPFRHSWRVVDDRLVAFGEVLPPPPPAS